MRNVMMGLAAAVCLGGLGLMEVSAGCPNGQCGAWSYSYSTPVYSSCGPNGCSAPVYRQLSAPPVADSPSAAVRRAPSVQTYGYRPYVTYYRGTVAYPARRVTAAPALTAQRAPVRVAAPPARPLPSDLPK